MAFTEDLTVFYDTTDFAVDATYTPLAGSPITIQVIPDKRYLAVNGIEGYRPIARIEESLVSSAGNGDTLVVNSITYTVRDVEPNGTGEVMFILEVV